MKKNTEKFGELLNVVANVRIRNVGRECGKPSGIAKVVKEQDGVLVCRNAHDATMLKRKYGIRTATIGNPKSMYGESKPVFFDDGALEELLRWANETARALGEAVSVLNVVAATAKDGLSALGAQS